MSNNIIAKEMFQNALNETIEKPIAGSFISSYIYLIIGIAFIGALVYLYLYYTKSPLIQFRKDTDTVISNEPKSDLLELLEKKPITPNVVEEKKPVPPNVVEEKHNTKQTEIKEHNKSLGQDTWCFIGEDISGRYCVKVPSKESCVPDRTFRSLQECALIDGNHLPAGIEKDGVNFSPLYSMNIEEK